MTPIARKYLDAHSPAQIAAAVDCNPETAWRWCHGTRAPGPHYDARLEAAAEAWHAARPEVAAVRAYLATVDAVNAARVALLEARLDPDIEADLDALRAALRDARGAEATALYWLREVVS